MDLNISICDANVKEIADLVMLLQNRQEREVSIMVGDDKVPMFMGTSGKKTQN